METSEIVTMSTVGSVGSLRLGSLCSPVERISGSSFFYSCQEPLKCKNPKCGITQKFSHFNCKYMIVSVQSIAKVAVKRLNKY